MSGSIGGNRIPHKYVNKTCLYYLENVLKPFEGFKEFSITGSYNARPKDDYGDIDLVVYIDSNEDLKKLILDCKKNGLKWIYTCGLGEPLEDKKFWNMLNVLKENNMLFKI